MKKLEEEEIIYQHLWLETKFAIEYNYKKFKEEYRKGKFLEIVNKLEKEKNEISTKKMVHTKNLQQ